MHLFKKVLLSFCAIQSIVSAGSLFADEAALDQKYTIVAGPENRVFLLNKQNGATWVYFHTSNEKQGWASLDFYTSDGQKANAIQTQK